LAPYLEEPLTIHAVAVIPGRFPMLACEWHVQPGSATVAITEFQHGEVEPRIWVIAQPPDTTHRDRGSEQAR
jgi:hypothetical protein